MPPTPGVTKANFDRIEIRATNQEVERIFGEPGIMRSMDGGVAAWESSYFWRASDGSSARIDFVCGLQIGERVTEKRWSPSAETIPEKLYRWLQFSPAKIRP